MEHKWWNTLTFFSKQKVTCENNDQILSNSWKRVYKTTQQDKNNNKIFVLRLIAIMSQCYRFWNKLESLNFGQDRNKILKKKNKKCISD